MPICLSQILPSIEDFLKIRKNSEGQIVFVLISISQASPPIDSSTKNYSKQQQVDKFFSLFVYNMLLCYGPLECDWLTALDHSVLSEIGALIGQYLSIY